MSKWSVCATRFVSIFMSCSWCHLNYASPQFFFLFNWTLPLFHKLFILVIYFVLTFFNTSHNINIIFIVYLPIKLYLIRENNIKNPFVCVCVCVWVKPHTIFIIISNTTLHLICSTLILGKLKVSNLTWTTQKYFIASVVIHNLCFF